MKYFIRFKLRNLTVAGLALIMAATSAVPFFAYPDQLMADTQDDLDAVNKQLEELRNKQSELNASYGELNEKLSASGEKLSSIEDAVNAKQSEIDDTNIQVADMQAEIDQQYAAMKLRIQFMYENAQESYFEALFDSESFSDFLNSAEYIIQIQEYDRKKLKEYQETVAYIDGVEQQLEEDYATLEEMKKEVEQEKASVEQEKASVAALMKQRETELAGIEGNIDSAQSDADYYAAEIQAQEEIIAEIRRIEAEKAAAGKQDNHYTGGVFTWPCPSSTRVTSDYGTRVSPMGGASSNHKGIDIGASGGAAIVAAADGTVTTAAYSSAAGNYVMIDHGGGLYTVYMHASALLVSPGQTVSAGQTIAQVGSTGISTGNHLHFGVSLNGSYVSPWSYLGR